MRRTCVHFSDDILMQEIIDMARSQGFHVRISCGMVCVDRVPGIVRRETSESNIIILPKKDRA